MCSCFHPCLENVVFVVMYVSSRLSVNVLH